MYKLLLEEIQRPPGGSEVVGEEDLTFALEEIQRPPGGSDVVGEKD